MDGRYGQAHHGPEMQLKLAEVGAMAQRHHARIVRTRTELREDDFSLSSEEELHAPQSGTRQGPGHLGSNMLGCLEGFF